MKAFTGDSILFENPLSDKKFDSLTMDESESFNFANIQFEEANSIVKQESSNDAKSTEVRIKRENDEVPDVICKRIRQIEPIIKEEPQEHPNTSYTNAFYPKVTVRLVHIV